MSRRRKASVLERSTMFFSLGWTFCYMFSILMVNEAQLSPESVSENPCLSPEPKPMWPKLDLLLVLTTMAKAAMEPFYVPMGSQHLYRSYAEYLLGRPPRTQDELENMNLRIRGSPTHTWITTGYDQRFIQQCIPAMALFKAFCIAGLGSEGTNMSPIRRTTNTLVWTDNKTAALITRCVLGYQNDWFVLSQTPTLEKDVMKQILVKVVELGFNASMATRHQYLT